MTGFNSKGQYINNPNSRNLNTDIGSVFPFSQIKINTEGRVGGRRITKVDFRKDPVGNYANSKRIKSVPFGGEILSNE